MADIAASLAQVRGQISAACRVVGRAVTEVELIAVSKTFPEAAIREAVAAGQLVFGESRQQEAAPKVAALPANLQWHFIGRVQRNKVRKLLPTFAVIHAIDSLRLATHVAEVAAECGLISKVFLQVNVAGEASKGGFEPDELRGAMAALLRLKHMEILGLMTIPPAGADAEASRSWFKQLRELRDRLERDYEASLPGLSMGMSGDYAVAIEEGATHVRVGSAIFGTRTVHVDGELA